jgi:hypothetical protein
MVPAFLQVLEFAPAGATKGLSGRPLETFGPIRSAGGAWLLGYDAYNLSGGMGKEGGTSGWLGKGLPVVISTRRNSPCHYRQPR